MKSNRTERVVSRAAVLFIALALLLAGACVKNQPTIATDASFQKKTQEALIGAKPGSVIDHNLFGCAAGRERQDNCSQP